jgi:hypothetical protein
MEVRHFRQTTLKKECSQEHIDMVVVQNTRLLLEGIEALERAGKGVGLDGRPSEHVRQWGTETVQKPCEGVIA